MQKEPMQKELPRAFRRMRLELARNREHPTGDPAFGYEIVAPLSADGKLDPELWRKHRENCRVRRFRPGERAEIGHLVHRQGGGWAFRFDILGDEEEEAGFRLRDELFAVGEYVSFRDADEDEMRTYQIVSVEHL